MAFFEFPHTRTYDSDLGWLIKTVGKLVECCEEVKEWQSEFETAYEEIKEIYDQIKDGNIPPEIQKALYEWTEKNAIDIVGNVVKSVFFGLTDSGYFVAYIPDSWDDITFNTTGYDTTVADVGYGHLTLSY